MKAPRRPSLNGFRSRIAKPKRRDINEPLLCRVVAMIPVSPRLAMSLKGVQKRVVLRNGTLSNEGDAIRVVGPILKDPMPVLGRAG